VSETPGDPDGRDQPSREEWLEAALEAERETGVHETTERAARAHVLVRLVRMSLGTIVLLAGLVAMIGPGPGLLLIAAGLAILARDVAWAERLLERVTRRLPTDAEGRIPRSTIATMVVAALAFTAFALWWTLR